MMAKSKMWKNCGDLYCFYVGNQDNTVFLIPNTYVAVHPESKTDVFWVFKVSEPNREIMLLMINPRFLLECII